MPDQEPNAQQQPVAEPKKTPPQPSLPDPGQPEFRGERHHPPHTRERKQ